MPTDPIPSTDPLGFRPPTGDLADAIRSIMNISSEATVPEVETVKVSDGKGGVVEIPVAMLPSGNGSVKAHPLLDVLQAGSRWAREQRLLDAGGPDARQGTAVHQALGSFIEHALRFRGDGTVVWADPTARRLVAVLDYHQEGAGSPAAWGRHRATYSPPVSEAWAAWGGVAGLQLDQDAFAQLLDGRDMDLTVGKLKDPTGNERPAPGPAERRHGGSDAPAARTASTSNGVRRAALTAPPFRPCRGGAGTRAAAAETSRPSAGGCGPRARVSAHGPAPRRRSSFFARER